MSKISHRVATGLWLAAAAGAPALAQSATGYEAGDALVHLSLAGVLPEDFSSSVSGLPGFKVKATDSLSPELDASYFFTPWLAVEAIAASTRHNVSIAKGGTHIKVGAVWVLPPTVTLQYHLPQWGAVRPYAGLGLTLAFWYGASPDTANGFTATGYSTGIGPALDAGFDLPLNGHWVANVDVKQIFIVTAAHVNHGAVHAITTLDPTVVGAGVGYLF